jgi:hypothetical protein
MVVLRNVAVMVPQSSSGVLRSWDCRGILVCVGCREWFCVRVLTNPDKNWRSCPDRQPPWRATGPHSRARSSSWPMSVEWPISKKETRQPSHQSVRNPLIRVLSATRMPPETIRHRDFHSIGSRLPMTCRIVISQPPLRASEPG